MNFKIKETYKFVTLAPAILGEKYNIMKVKGIVTADDAVKYMDVHEMNQKLLSTIPGLPVNAEDNTYIVFENSNKELVVFAYEWIDEESIEVVAGINVRIDLPNVTTENLTIVKTALLELGHFDMQIYTY